MLVFPREIRWLFLAIAIIVLPTWFAILIWALVRVPPHSGLLTQKAVLGGNELSWGWLSALSIVLWGVTRFSVLTSQILLWVAMLGPVASTHVIWSPKSLFYMSRGDRTREAYKHLLSLFLIKQ